MTLIAPHYQKGEKKSAFPFLRKDRFLVKTPWWLKKIYPHCLWDMPQKEKTLYLTFDDGPHPLITSFVLGQLKKYNAKATFFCIGENVMKYPEEYRRYIEEGHAVGNHTHHHVNGWKTDTAAYLKDVKDASFYIQSNLFRPPYGRITKSQINGIRSGNMNNAQVSIVMWNILAGDWVADLSPQKCYERIRARISDGDIIVLHESDKSWERMSYCLPRLLAEFSGQGYQFEVIK